MFNRFFRGNVTRLTLSSKCGQLYRPAESIYLNYVKMGSLALHTTARLSQPANTESPTACTKVLEQLARLFPQDYLTRVNVAGIFHMVPTTVNIFETAVKWNGLNPYNVGIYSKFNSECSSAITEIREKNLARICVDNGFHPANKDSMRDYVAMEKAIFSGNNYPSITVYHGNVGDISYRRKLEKECGIKAEIGIECTRSGKNNLDDLHPVIAPFGCGIKNDFEPYLIADQFLNAVKEKIPEFAAGHLSCGVFGFGVVGERWVNQLLRTKHRVHVYDPNLVTIPPESYSAFENVKFHHTPEAVIEASKYIFNCTPVDITTASTKNTFVQRNGRKVLAGTSLGQLLKESQSEKVLISCSSDRTAYNKLIADIESESKVKLDPLTDIKHNKLLILKGGYPINFTKRGDASAPEDIVLTRAIIYASLIQAKALIDSKTPLPERPRKIMLDPGLQEFVVRAWEQHNSNPNKFFSKNLIEKYKSKSYIMGRSEGEYVLIPSIQQALADFEERNASGKKLRF